MRLRTLLLVLLLAIVTAFIAVNWNAFTAPTSLDLVITSIQAPLGLVMVGLLSTLVVAFALYIVFWQSALLVDMRRNAKEMQQHRTLADQAEASRFTELRTAMLEQMKLLNERVALAEQQLRTDIHETSNGTAALFAELDDRLTQQASRPR